MTSNADHQYFGICHTQQTFRKLWIFSKVFETDLTPWNALGNIGCRWLSGTAEKRGRFDKPEICIKA